MGQVATSLLYIGGSKQSFRCLNEERSDTPGRGMVKCGSNCFHHPEPDDKDLWECNACGARYRSD